LRRAQTALHSDYSKGKMQNVLKIPKRRAGFPSHHRMKKTLLVATVLVGGLAFAHAGVNVSIGIGLPLPPLPGIVIRAPAPYCPPPVYVPPVCPPRVVVPCPPVRYQPYCPPYYPKYGHGHGDWNRHGRGHNRGHGYRH